jgi:hypothetical protein
MLEAKTADVCTRLEVCPRKSWRRFSHESRYSHSTCQGAPNNAKRRTYRVTEAYIVGTRQAETSSLLPAVSGLPAQSVGNTRHHVVYG